MTLAERIAEKAVTLVEKEEGTPGETFIYVRCFGYRAGSFWKADRYLAEVRLAEVRAEVAALIAAELEKENDIFQTALEEIEGIKGVAEENAWQVCVEMVRIARNALAEGGDGD